MVKHLGGHEPEAFLAALAEAFTPRPVTLASDADARPASAGHLPHDPGRDLVPPAHPALALVDEGDPVNSLDVAVLPDGVRFSSASLDPHTDTGIDFVGIRGPEATTGTCLGVDGRVAFSLYPTGIDQLLAIADAGAQAAEVDKVRTETPLRDGRPSALRPAGRNTTGPVPPPRRPGGCGRRRAVRH